MIGLEEVSARSVMEGLGCCRERSASEIADATGNHRPHLSSYEELLNHNATWIVGEKELRYGRRGGRRDDRDASVSGANSNREALMIGDLITALESKFKFGRK